MTALEVLLIVTAGLVAGTMNTVIGSGSLITFPALLMLGYTPVVANVTNCIGLMPGSISGAIGYRSLLAGQRDRVLRLGAVALVGGAAGALALLVLPADLFRRVVIVLIVVAVVLMVAQPRLNTWISRLRPSRAGLGLMVGVFLTAGYGGYFGAAHGVILISVLSLFLSEGLQTVNAMKNVLGSVVSVVAAVIFAISTHVEWGAAGLLAVGTMTGGYLGAVVGRRIPPWLLRVLVIVIAAITILTLTR